MEKVTNIVQTFAKSFTLKNWKRYFILAVLITICVVLYTSTSTPYRHGLQHRPCKLHTLDPWDKTLKGFLKTPKPVKCSTAYSLMYVDHLGVLQLNQSAVSYYELTSFECVYHKITRKSNDKEINIDTAVPFTAPLFIESRVFQVVCRVPSAKVVYDFVHVNVAWNESQYRETKIEPETDEDLSIIYFGLDSSSRSHALRKLPNAYKYLKDTIGAYDFRGYMKVGLNSFPNLVPMLTGTEHDKYHMENILRFQLDKMPFIWTEPAMERYVTTHIEDRPDIATMNYLKAGFKKRPVDYYFREFGLAMAQLEPTIMHALGESSWFCYGNKQHFLMQIDYLKRFVTKYTNRLKFSFLWNNQIGHEDFISLGRGDEPLYEFLQWMKENGHLERSVLIVGSDHGFRLGGASTTYVGRLENNMPFLMVHIPEVLKKRYPWIHDNMVQNSKRLTSAFDIHATMMDILNKDFRNTVDLTVYNERTSRSFLKKIPEKRSCADAGIPAQYCTCYDATSVNSTDDVVIMAAEFVVQHLNSVLSKFQSLCRRLYLLNITESKVMYTAEGDSDNLHIDHKPNFIKRFLGHTADKSGRYILMLYTSPNNGLIEAMVDYEQQPERGPANKFTLIGDPVRANKYGNQSHCIDDSTLRQYCLCKDVTEV